MDHKNIDKLFQEQLKNLEVSPNKSAWNNIETKLKKKKRKVFPIWWFSGAAVAILILGFFIFPFSKNDIQNTPNSFDEIITTIPKEKKTIEKKIDSIITDKILKNDVLISKNTSNNTSKNNTQKFSEKHQNKVLSKPIKTKQLLQIYSFSFDLNSTEFQDHITLFSSKEILKKEDIHQLNIKDLSEEIKDKIIAISELKNWSVTPVFAVLQSNSFTNSSPINKNLASSTKGENTYSYGVQIAYKINKKWTIQSGIHLQEMSYSNNQINISFSEQSNTTTTQFTNGDTFSFVENNNNFLSLSSDFTSTLSTNGNLTQNYGYVEIPVELKYNLSHNRKLETQIVTGFSSLFLNKNNVNLNTENLSTTLEAKNLNSINFSANLGFDFNYLFDKNWSLQLNPMFKVQLNTFNEDSNGFAPFNLGIYTGIKYNF